VTGAAIRTRVLGAACFAAAIGLALPAWADGPALAFVTVEGRTVTLTAEGAMVAWVEDAVHLHFAQLHLGFPVPPELRLVLADGDSGWRVEALSYHRLEGPIVLDASTAQIQGASGGPDDLRVEIAVEGLVPGALGQPEPVPVEIEITLRSP